jgi:hypothetical protein
MAALFGNKRDEDGAVAAPSAAEEIARLDALPLPRLAAEVMEKAFAGDGPGAPGKPGTIEAPELSAERVGAGRGAGRADGRAGARLKIRGSSSGSRAFDSPATSVT